jgi:hypothetical protein
VVESAFSVDLGCFEEFFHDVTVAEELLVAVIETRLIGIAVVGARTHSEMQSLWFYKFRSTTYVVGGCHIP